MTGVDIDCYQTCGRDQINPFLKATNGKYCTYFILYNSTDMFICATKEFNKGNKTCR